MTETDANSINTDAHTTHDCFNRDWRYSQAFVTLMTLEDEQDRRAFLLTLDDDEMAVLLAEYVKWLQNYVRSVELYVSQMMRILERGFESMAEVICDLW